MIFNYGKTKLEDGYYIVAINDEPPQIAEFLIDQWLQIGIDYDVWCYNRSFKEATITLLGKIDLTTMEITKL